MNEVNYAQSATDPAFKADMWKDSILSTAYWAVDGAPKYTFLNADIESLKSPDENADENAQENHPDGWTITWTSKETCEHNANKKFTVTLTGTCEQPAEGSTETAGTFFDEKVGSDKCSATVSYKGAHACGGDIPLIQALNNLAGFVGIILIAFGAVMCFYGTKFLFQVMGLIIGCVVTSFLFLLSYALFLPVDAKTGMVAGVLVFCVVLGAVFSYYTYKLTRSYTVPILGAIGGVVVFLMVARLLKLKKPINIVASVAGGALGWFLADRFKRIIRAAGTALVGSFILVRGVGMYLPGYPSDLSNANSLIKNPHANMEAIAYIAGFVVLAIVGTIFQMKTQEMPEEEDEMNEKFM